MPDVASTSHQAAHLQAVARGYLILASICLVSSRPTLAQTYIEDAVAVLGVRAAAATPIAAGD